MQERQWEKELLLQQGQSARSGQPLWPLLRGPTPKIKAKSLKREDSQTLISGVTTSVPSCASKFNFPRIQTIDILSQFTDEEKIFDMQESTQQVRKDKSLLTLTK